MLIVPGRVMLTLFVFLPLALGLMVHRIKIGNRTDAEARGNLPVEEVTFRTADGLRLSGWFLPDRDSDSTVVICHGSGANKSNFVGFMRVFRFQGYNSLIFDFRGHGASEGHTCTFGLFEDADVRAAVDWLKTERPERARHVYGLGSSMGAMALARAAATDTRIEAVVLDSCFASAPLLLRQRLGGIPLIGPTMATLISIAATLHAGASLWQCDARPAVAAISPRPILFIHGADDAMIPPVNMEILFACAKEPKDKWLGPGPHSNILTTDFAGYQQRVIAFLSLQGRHKRSTGDDDHDQPRNCQTGHPLRTARAPAV
jgi:pimeloyl-ACP methyl ester carboxylesterase